MENTTNKVWQEKLYECLTAPDYVVEPRDMEVRELLHGSYTVDMPAYIDLKDRKVNLPFMLAEAAWIISGSNRLSDISEFMAYYANFSDDGIFLRGAYGPKVIDQLGYIVDTLASDEDSRQAYLNIWRERPGSSKDIPCTTGMQFFIRGGELHSVVNMRSNDIVLGFTYDVFSFSMVANAVRLLLSERGVRVGLGSLTVNAGSLHIYEKHYEQAEDWIASTEIDGQIKKVVDLVMSEVTSYEELINVLFEQARSIKNAN